MFSEYANSPSFLLELTQVVNLGLVLVDGEERIVLWNRWMEERSQRPAAQVLGQSLTNLFPDLQGSRLEHAIRTALQQHLPSVLSQSLNRSPFPLFDPIRRQGERLEQAITVLPLIRSDQCHCLIQIQDVTAAVHRERTLREQAQQLQMLSSTDGLTGVPNRRSFDDRFQEEFQRALRKGTPLSLLMLDIDHFKLYNDTYGHQVGDACLIAVAHVLRSSLQRGSDFVARYGGEEFAMLLPESDPEGAGHIAQRVLERVAALRIPQGQNRGFSQVTVSIGIASRIPRRGDTPEVLLQEADQALYQAKEQGRAQASLSPAADPAPGDNEA